jgi:hypothetical protein
VPIGEYRYMNTMPAFLSTRRPRSPRALLLSLIAAVFLSLIAAASSSADVSTFGSPLSVPATLNTAENLGYPGTNTAVPPAPDAPNGVFHTFHYGADTALWSIGQVAGDPLVPATGQALKVSLEGCAQRAAGGPSPLTEIHFQDITPLPGGGAKVNITSQGFNIPICGDGGASGSTVSTYEPINLCVSEGDYVAFNDEGGYVPNVYRDGVPYQVLGAVRGSTTDSFVKDGGTGNGATMSAGETSANDGFATNHGEELMMRVTLGTGNDATHICPGGKHGAPPVLAPIRVSPQTDGINHSRIVAVAVFCRVTPCKGVATISTSDGTYGRAGFDLIANKTVHLPIRVKSQFVTKIRRNHGVSATLAAVVNGKTTTQKISVKIL